MKYAIISDVHGNMDALSAVLKDAQSFDIDKYIFVGDYCSYLPYPNEVVAKIKGLENAIIIQGNEERYFIEYSKQDQRTWTDGQFQAHYWCYRAISNINHDYLAALPKMLTTKDCGANITVTHSSFDIFGDIEHSEFTSLKVAERYRENNGYSREQFHTSGIFKPLVCDISKRYFMVSFALAYSQTAIPFSPLLMERAILGFFHVSNVASMVALGFWA